MSDNVLPHLGIATLDEMSAPSRGDILIDGHFVPLYGDIARTLRHAEIHGIDQGEGDRSNGLEQGMPFAGFATHENRSFRPLITQAPQALPATSPASPH